MILAGQFSPGDRLPERHLVDELGVSRTPVREALRRLNAEGLVTFEPNRGARVLRIDPEDISDLFELGLSLESYAVGLAAQRAEPSDIAEMEIILADIENVVSQSDGEIRPAYTELDLLFHSHLVSCAKNSRLTSLTRQVVGMPALVNIYAHYEHAHYVRSCRQHREILDAVKARDGEWASAAMRSHILSGKHHLDRE